MAQFKVDTTEKIRTSIGVAKYNEYAKAMEDKHGKDKAAEIIAEPSNQLKDIEAYQVLYRLAICLPVLSYLACCLSWVMGSMCLQ